MVKNVPLFMVNIVHVICKLANTPVEENTKEKR